MLRLSVDLRQLHKLSRRLDAAYARTKTGRAAMALKIAEGIKELAEERIRTTKTAPDGTPWLPWASSYAATRSGTHSLLMDTRELLDSFEASASAAGQQAKVANTADHAGYVQAKRPFLGIGAREQALAEELAQDWLERLVSV